MMFFCDNGADFFCGKDLTAFAQSLDKKIYTCYFLFWKK